MFTNTMMFAYLYMKQMTWINVDPQKLTHVNVTVTSALKVV